MKSNFSSTEQRGLFVPSSSKERFSSRSGRGVTGRRWWATTTRRWVAVAKRCAREREERGREEKRRKERESLNNPHIYIIIKLIYFLSQQIQSPI